MIDKELKSIWQGAAPEIMIKVEKSRLLIDTDHKLSKLYRTLKFRDIRETVAAAVVIVMFGRFLYYSTSMIKSLGLIMMMASLSLMVFHVLWIRRYLASEKLKLDIKEYLAQWLRGIEKQIHLMKNVLWLYLVPMGAGSVLFFIGKMLPAHVMVINISIAASVFIGVYFLNIWAVKKYLVPVKNQILNLIKKLNGE